MDIILEEYPFRTLFLQICDKICGRNRRVSKNRLNYEYIPHKLKNTG